MEGIQKKIAVLNDLSGYGRCSLTAAMPVISALKVPVLSGGDGGAVQSRGISGMLYG
ncbi:MAG: hypothetical protein ACLTR6_06415 [Clostridium fessum]